MSLETAVQNLADAINALAGTQGAKVSKPAGKSNPETVTAIAGAAKEAVKTPAKTPETPPAGDKALDYIVDVKPKFLDYGKAKGRDAALALLAEFGVKGATEIPADQWQKFLDRITELSA